MAIVAPPGVDGSAHHVQFFDTIRELAASVAEFVAEGAACGEGALLVAAPARLRAISGALAAHGPTGARPPESGVVLLPSHQAMTRVVTGGTPDPGRFATVVGDAVRTLAARHGRVRMFNDMVAGLWRAGHMTGALALEDLGNELVRELPVSLYCAYASRLAKAAPVDQLDAICRSHSSIAGTGALGLRATSVRRFPASRRAPAGARQFVAEVVPEAEDAELWSAATLVVSELATNVVVHGPSPFTVTLSRLSDSLRIAVRDDLRTVPLPRRAAHDGVTGRGLGIVEVLARAWGTSLLHGGKTVWAELEAPAGPRGRREP